MKGDSADMEELIQWKEDGRKKKNISSYIYYKSLHLHYVLNFILLPETMIIPIRCFSCGKVIGNKWEAYLGLLQVQQLNSLTFSLS